MKKYFSILALLFLITGCSKQVDEISPRHAIEQDDLTDGDIGKLRNGVYAQAEVGVFSFAFDFDKRASNFRGGPGFSLVDPVNMSPSESNILSMWRSAYNRIADINFLLETLDKSANTTANQTIRGEALYFRGLFYYLLVTRWGGVPVLTKRTFEIIPRATEAEVWKQVTDDLGAAELLLPVFSNKFYLSKQAAQALLARVYQALGDNARAITYADMVINSGKFSLAADAIGYASNFIAASDSKEIIFGFVNSNVNSRKLFYQSVNDVDGTWEFSPATSLFTALYANATNRTGDKRKTAVFSADNTRIIKFPNGKTGQQLVSTANADATPLIISRLPEMYLLKAEAVDAGASAETVLAPYFAARYTTPPAAGTIAALNSTDFQSLVLNERQREFYGEGYRWYEIKRTNRLDLLPSLAGRNYLLYYPIPQVEIDLAGYTQNPGY